MTKKIEPEPKAGDTTEIWDEDHLVNRGTLVHSPWMGWHTIKTKGGERFEYPPRFTARKVPTELDQAKDLLERLGAEVTHAETDMVAAQRRFYDVRDRYATQAAHVQRLEQTEREAQAAAKIERVLTAADDKTIGGAKLTSD